MTLRTIEGHYQNGRVELSETPQEVDSSRVLVVFLPDGNSQEGNLTESDRDVVRRRVLERMKRGYHLGGGKPYEKREDLYDRGDSGE